MAAFGFAMVGLSQLTRSSRRGTGELMPAIERKVREALELIAGRAKFNIRGSRETNPPERLGVVTGRLRGSIGVDIFEVKRDSGGVQGRVGTRVKYGPRHEFGIGQTPKRAFMSPAVEAMRERVFELLGEGFDVALKP